MIYCGKERLLFILWLTVTIALALILRYPMLTARLFHADEAVQAYKTVELINSGQYKYDPNEFHGPTLQYISAWLLKLAGASQTSNLTEFHLRCIILLFGIVTILSIVIWLKIVGIWAVGISALFLAVSVPFVFYNTYYIHETLLVCFLSFFLASLWQAFLTEKKIWLIISGVSLGLMYATKETFVLSALAAFITIIILYRNSVFHHPQLHGRNFIIIILIAIATAFVWFSSFFQNLAGPIDAIRTYLPWLKRGLGENSYHVYPYWFYWKRLLLWKTEKGPIFSEAGIYAIAIVGALWAIKGINSPRLPILRYLMLYSIITATIYTIIPYKTPWCVLTFHFGFIIAAGLTLGIVIEQGRIWKTTAALFIIGLITTASIIQDRIMLYRVPSTPQNPWVYAHTDPALKTLIEFVLGTVHSAPNPDKVIVKVISPNADYWPLPWYFRNIALVGWYSELPNEMCGDIVVFNARIPFKPPATEEEDWIMAGFHKFRPNVFFCMYVKFDLWKRYIESRIIKEGSS